MNAKILIQKIAKKEIATIPLDPVHAYYYLMGLIANEAMHGEEDTLPKLPETFFAESPKSGDSTINKYDQMKKKREESKIHLETPPESLIKTAQKKRWEGRKRTPRNFEAQKGKLLQWMTINKSSIRDLLIFLELDPEDINTNNAMRKFMNQWVDETDSPIINEMGKGQLTNRATFYYFAKNFGKRVEINSVLGVRS